MHLSSRKEIARKPGITKKKVLSTSNIDWSRTVEAKFLVQKAPFEFEYNVPQTKKPQKRISVCFLITAISSNGPDFSYNLESLIFKPKLMVSYLNNCISTGPLSATILVRGFLLQQNERMAG